MSLSEADIWIRKLDMLPLPEEGGWYRETYRSDEFIPKHCLPERFSDRRTFATSIYYLLKSDEFSAFHRINQEEIWHFYMGSSLRLHIIDKIGNYSTAVMGPDIDNGAHFQFTINRGDLFAAEVIEADHFSLVGCTVAPGFEFDDFQVPDRKDLIKRYPEHAVIIERFTR